MGFFTTTNNRCDQQKLVPGLAAPRQERAARDRVLRRVARAHVARRDPSLARGIEQSELWERREETGNERRNHRGPRSANRIIDDTELPRSQWRALSSNTTKIAAGTQSRAQARPQHELTRWFVSSAHNTRTRARHLVEPRSGRLGARRVLGVRERDVIAPVAADALDGRGAPRGALAEARLDLVARLEREARDGAPRRRTRVHALERAHLRVCVCGRCRA